MNEKLPTWVRVTGQFSKGRRHFRPNQTYKLSETMMGNDYITAKELAQLRADKRIAEEHIEA